MLLAESIQNSACSSTSYSSVRSHVSRQYLLCEFELEHRK